jgi:hypothetical protein
MPRRIGEILVDAEAISAEQLSEALAVQRQSGMLLGEALVSCGHLSPLRLAGVLSEQLECERGLPDADVLGAGVSGRLDPDFAESHGIALLSAAAEPPLVGTVDPTDVIGIDAVRRQLRTSEIELSVLTPSELRLALTAQHGLWDALQEMREWSGVEGPGRSIRQSRMSAHSGSAGPRSESSTSCCGPSQRRAQMIATSRSMMRTPSCGCGWTANC